MRKCPKCGKIGQYDVLAWWQQGGMFGLDRRGLPAGSERTGCLLIIILVTNAFPSKKQYYFVEKTVFVISPVNLEPITYTLRESLVKMPLLKMTNEAKQNAVQRVYDYLSSSEYNNMMNDVATQLIDLAKDLKVEIKSHKDRWEKRYSIYRRLYSDVGLIDFKLKNLVQNQLDDKTKLLPPPKKEFVAIEELGH